MTSIVLADDHTIVREGIAAILSAEPDFKIVGQAADGEQAFEMIKSLQPDVAIVDLQMPKLYGIEVIRRTRKVGDAKAALMSRSSPTASTFFQSSRKLRLIVTSLTG